MDEEADRSFRFTKSYKSTIFSIPPKLRNMNHSIYQMELLVIYTHNFQFMVTIDDWNNENGSPANQRTGNTISMYGR